MNNKLQALVEQSGLEQPKAQVILNTFREYFDIAAEWEIKAKTLVVTDASQLAEMEMARTGRLFIRDKRLVIERTRKELKEQSLREGKAIDGIANVLKGLLEPIEEHLRQQECFLEIRALKKAEEERQEAIRKQEAERLEKERLDKEEAERIRKENEKLKAEALEREKQIAEERKKIEEAAAEERKKVEAERQKEREAAEQKLKEERAAAEKVRRDAEAKAAEEKRQFDEKVRRLMDGDVECPNCRHKFNLREVA